MLITLISHSIVFWFLILLQCSIFSTVVSVHQCGETETYCPDEQQCCQANYSPTGYGCLIDLHHHPHLNSSSIDPCCKPGPSLPPSENIPNCLILGDSVSIGYTSTVIDNLKTICQVQHAPYDTSDGGAESTLQTIACLDNFLVTQIQTKVYWDVILFNFGLHNLDYTTPCLQNLYRKQLYNITKRLLSIPPNIKRSNYHYHYQRSNIRTSTNSNDENKLRLPKLIYATTTPFMPEANKGNMIVDELNAIAVKVMKQIEIDFLDNNKIRILDLNKVVHNHCGTMYESCDWCRKDPCSYHYNAAGNNFLGIYAAAAIRAELGICNNNKSN